MSDLIGTELGPYRILERIGLGGMATVFKAYHPTMDRYVAVKVLPEHMSHDPAFRQRFEREARVIARLEHAHILPVYDSGEQGGRLFLVMRYVEAGTLKDRMAAGPMDLAEIGEVLDQLAAALAYAHRQEVVHRDVKPGNVLMDAQGDCYLTDFGLAKMMEASVQLTATGVGLGTPAYMAPEQGKGEQVDGRSDIYSLGVMLYEMVTGQVPFQAETPLAVVLKHITDPLPLPSEVKPDIHPAVERVILKALAKNPDDRFASADEMAVAFQRALSEADTVPLLFTPAPAAAQATAETPFPLEEVAAPARRRAPRCALGLGALALLALAGVALVVTGVVRPPGAATPVPTAAMVVAEAQPATPPLELAAAAEPAAAPALPPAAEPPPPPPTHTFVDSGQRLGESNSHAVALGDLDGDGDLDAVVGNHGEGARVWMNLGGEQGQAPGHFDDRDQALEVSGAEILAVALGDLDGDGDLDAFLGNRVGANQVWLNDGSGHFINSRQRLGDAQSTTVALGDVDGDGDLDALVGNGVELAQADEIWLNDGAGRFAASDQRLTAGMTWVATLGDLDGDGDLDAFVARSGVSSVWLNQGGLQGGTPGAFSDSGQQIGPSDNVSLALGDLDGDEDLDAMLGIAGPAGEPNQVWLNDGSGLFNDSGQRLGRGASAGITLGDLDGDGDLDGFVANGFKQPNRVWLNDGTGALHDSGQQLGRADSWSVALGDLDGDGDLDAFVSNDGPNEVWQNETQGDADETMPFPPPPETGKQVDECEGVRPPQLCVRDFQTQKIVKITDDLAFDKIGRMVWSPDGQQIVFDGGWRDDGSGQSGSKLYLINADGSDLRQITQGDVEGGEGNADWSPDGEWIVYNRSGELWLVHPDGSAARQILERAYNRSVGDPAWSPDGRQIFFTNISPSTPPEVWVVAHDGSNPQVVYAFDRELEDWEGWGWSPDGSGIAIRYKEGSGHVCLLVSADGSGPVGRIERGCPDQWYRGFWPRLDRSKP